MNLHVDQVAHFYVPKPRSRGDEPMAAMPTVQIEDKTPLTRG